MSSNMETGAAVLLVTANVGSLFEHVGEIQRKWLHELFTTVHRYNSQFIALHFQEVGGKSCPETMNHAEIFFRAIASSEEMKDYDRVCIYVDNQFKAEDNFTALGSMYLIHKTLENVSQYDFKAKDFRAVSGHDWHIDSLDTVTTVEKERFSKDFWPDFKWSRKGFMRTRWRIHQQDLDLVNVHLFHDASNLIAHKRNPSIYSDNRRRALRHVIDRITGTQGKASRDTLPFFVFGDFNFRLDTCSLVKHLCTSAEKQTVLNACNSEVRIVWKEKDNGHKDLLQMEEKLFAYLHHEDFTKDNGRNLLEYDKEVAAFHDHVREEDIKFPPSYPYSEKNTQPTQYAKTRCPAWCDRILMSHSAQQIIHTGDGERDIVYDTMGPNVCMGDHKPVFLFFPLKRNDH